MESLMENWYDWSIFTDVPLCRFSPVEPIGPC